MPKPVRQTATKGFRGSGTTQDDHISDPRFANIQTDPRFRLPSRKNTHVQIDKRFAHMLRDEGFSSKAKVDRYGRKLPKDSGRKELERYYRIEGEGKDGAKSEVDDEEVQLELERANAEEKGPSSSEESSSDDESVEVEEDEVFGFPDEQGGDAEGVPMGEVSSRIAVVNLDWDNIRAADLMAVFSSFTPGNGRILKVSVYPSEFGKERMEREEMEGPPKEIFAQSKPNRHEEDVSSNSEEDNEEGVNNEEEDQKIKDSILKEDEGHEFNSAKLRRYQLERLRYYYAVLSCSSDSVAQAIYEAIDGTEYLTTANFFDLRFIPDEVEFVDDKPRDQCDRIPDGYRPNDFVTDALQHSKVRLTWDADDGTRKEAQKRAFAGSRAEIDENDLKAYLGSDSSEDERPEPTVVDTTLGTVTENKPDVAPAETGPKSSKKDVERQRMRALLGLQQEPAAKNKSKARTNEPVGDMQVTFSSGLTSEPNSGSVFVNEPERNETTVEKYVRREKERKSRRKEKLKSTRIATADPPAEQTSENEANETQPTSDAQAADSTSLQDLGFQDPFFTDPSAAAAATNALRKSERAQKRTERLASAATTAAQRAELELLLDSDHDHGHADVSNTKAGPKHFDINTIAKAEKAALKKKKRRKLSGREKEALESQGKDGFRMDVGDPRFGAVFERSEFAIDPSHPRFKATGGMKELLEEGRRKRGRDEGRESPEDRGAGRKKGRREGEGEGEDVKRLVARIKGKGKGGEE